jgi:protein Tex
MMRGEKMTHSLHDILARQHTLPRRSVENIVCFYEEKATIPFVARYRKDQTGNLDEVQVAALYDSINYYQELFARKTFVLEEIEKKGKLTDDLRRKIEECLDAKKLEDLYLPYKEKKKTKAEKAREAGLEPLAHLLISFHDEGEPRERAKEFLNPEKGYDTVEKALEGALYIISQRIIESVEVMETFLKKAFASGMLISKARKGYKGDDNRFEDYYDYEEQLSQLRIAKSSHRYLALKRGAALEVLALKTEVGDDENIHEIRTRFLKKEHFYRAWIEEAMELAYRQYLRPALDTRIFSELTEIAEEEAIKVFARNLESLLMAPPIPYKSVLGLDPGIRTGIKVALLDRDGSYVEHRVFYINSAADVKKSSEELKSLIAKHGIGAIAIGNGTGCRETLAFVNSLVKENRYPITVAVVDESGASVYSASEVAREEFPELDITVRGAISIGRRLQNPLAELVKIDPKSIGVGQYQHDVEPKKLKEALMRVIEICVNNVGVDINTASYSILTYISGLSEKVARSIVEYRREHGFFKSREKLMKVKGVGPKVFEQSAGFLIVRDCQNPLDATRIHPESYPVVVKIAEKSALKVRDVIGNKELLKKLDAKEFLTETCGALYFKALVEELSQPMKDPRKEFKTVAYREGVEKIEDVKEKMTFEGRVTNVTNFGAFIDIGVHHDGLCHVSQMADRFVRDPGEIVSVGDIVRVMVISVDYGKKRLSLKLLANT